MTARELFGVVVRSIGVICILWGLDSAVRLPLTLLLLPAGKFGVFGSGAFSEMGGGFFTIGLGVVLLVACAGPSGWSTAIPHFPMPVRIGIQMLIPID